MRTKEGDFFIHKSKVGSGDSILGWMSKVRLGRISITFGNPHKAVAGPAKKNSRENGDIPFWTIWS